MVGGDFAKILMIEGVMIFYYLGIWWKYC